MQYKTIKDEIKKAMLTKDVVRLQVLRGLSATCTNEMIAKGKDENNFTEEDTNAVVKRAVKQRKDSIEQFTKGGREDLATAEKAELAILETFLPKMMSEEEIKKVVEEKIKNAGTIDKTKIGMFIGGIMKDLKGQADGALVKKIVEELVK